MSETWKGVEGFPGYEVSDHGRVRSLPRYGAGGRLLVPIRHRGGYLRVNLYRDKTIRKILVHRLVAMAFVKGYSQELDVHHCDHIRDNNYASNLTCLERKEHARRHSAGKRTGKDNPRATITEVEVRQIRELTAAGLIARDVASYIGVSRSIVADICCGRNWSHVR